MGTGVVAAEGSCLCDAAKGFGGRPTWDPTGPTPTWTSNCADKSTTCVGEGQELSSGACVCSISNGFYGTPSFVNPFSSTASHWAGTCTTCTEVSMRRRVLQPAPFPTPRGSPTHQCSTTASPPPHNRLATATATLSNPVAKRLLASACPLPPQS